MEPNKDEQLEDMGKCNSGWWMEMSFKSELHPHQEWPDWTVCNDTDIIQTDGCSCGPIACAKVMEVFGILEPGSMATIEKYPGGYCAVVMEYYERLVINSLTAMWRQDAAFFIELRARVITPRIFGRF